ncbi:MAG: cysteine synthase A, partial [Clostridia bacterium]|nr:cysteine synthase A [Clostridia bacterium]
MKKIAQSLTELIGNTPLLELKNFSKKNNLKRNL